MDEKTKALYVAQNKFLDRVAPGYTTRRVAWSGGSTQIIEYGKGEPVLMVHGGLGEALQWGPVLPILGQQYRILAIDRPGHGLADPFNYKNVDLLSHACQFLHDIIEKENLSRFHLVGVSMGGLWTTVYALQHPEKIAKLVLVGSPAGITRKIPFQMRVGALPGLKNMIRKMMLQPTNKSTYAFWKQMLVANPDKLSEDLLDALTASQARNAPNWFTLLDVSVDFWGLKPHLVLGDRWNKLSVPTTFIWGEQDVWAPLSSGEKVVASNRHCRLIKIPNAGHAPWIDDPYRVSAAMLSAMKQV
jgi:pimeloyl-ACP methyl ester carboxylesterase